MYVYLGSDTVVRNCDIIGIFDIEKTSVGKITKEYLSASGKRRSACYVSYDMPKSFVAATRNGRERVYISSVLPQTIIKRCKENTYKEG